MSIGKRIKQLRLDRDLTQIDVGKIAGVTDKAVSTWEKDEKIPRMGAIEKLAAYFGVTKSYIIDGIQDIPSGFIPVPQMQRVPTVGTIACKDPITAEENIEGYAETPADRQMDFALICKGDSMIDAGIKDGNIVYIRKQPRVENGQIAAVRIDNEATLKRVYFHGDTLILQPANANYPPLSFSGAALETVVIEGLAVGFTHWM